MNKNVEFEKLIRDFNSGFKAGSQTKLASELKVSVQAISSWINRKTLPSSENISKMSKIFKKKEEELQKIFSSTVSDTEQKLIEENKFLKERIKFLEEQVMFYKEKCAKLEKIFRN